MPTIRANSKSCCMCCNEPTASSNSSAANSAHQGRTGSRNADFRWSAICPAIGSEIRWWSEMNMAKAPTASTATGYCMKCKTQRQIKDAKPITMKNGRAATEGTCPECGT